MKSERNNPYKTTGVKRVSKYKIFRQYDRSASKREILSGIPVLQAFPQVQGQQFQCVLSFRPSQPPSLFLFHREDTTLNEAVKTSFWNKLTLQTTSAPSVVARVQGGPRKPTGYHVCDLCRGPCLRLSQLLRHAEGSFLAWQVKADRSPDPDIWEREA